MDPVAASLSIMWKGMAAIFVVIFVTFVAVRLLLVCTKDRKKKED